MCQNLTCRCGEEVDKFKLHPLSCVKSGGRYPRHCALNDCVSSFKRRFLLQSFLNVSHPNVLYASSNVLIVPLPLLPLTFFGFLTYQPIALSSTPNTKIFLFLPSTLFPLLPLVGKISVAFFPNNPLFLLFSLKIFMTISTTRFFPLEIIVHHLTPPASSSASVSFSRFSPITFTDLIFIIKSVSSSSCSLDLIPPKIFNDLFSLLSFLILLTFLLLLLNFPPPLNHLSLLQ